MSTGFPSDYRVAIPSYMRADILGEKTLPTLINLGMDPERIDIFVANKQQRELYRHHLGDMNFVVGVPGMMPIRRFIHKHYPEGQKLVCADDDIDGLYKKIDDRQFLQMTSNQDWEEMIATGFDTCSVSGANLWGIYPVLNAMFMKHRITYDLRYIVGAFWGCINTHDKRVLGTQEYKEDFERSIRFYKRDNSVVRLEMFSLKTAYYKTPGGMQGNRTPELEAEGARALAQAFPDLCSLNFSKKSGYVELRLKDKNRKQREVLV